MKKLKKIIPLFAILLVFTVSNSYFENSEAEYVMPKTVGKETLNPDGSISYRCPVPMGNIGCIY